MEMIAKPHEDKLFQVTLKQSNLTVHLATGYALRTKKKPANKS